jgi:regulatory protein
MNNTESKPGNEILEKMQILCSRREICTSEIRKKLLAYNLSVQEIERIIEILSKENYINDERYAISFAHDKFRFNKWGKIKIEYELKHRGISDIHIMKAMDGIDSKEYKDMIKSELIKKLRKDKSSRAYVLKSKLLRFGQSKGFETDLVFNIINEILNSYR